MSKHYACNRCNKDMGTKNENFTNLSAHRYYCFGEEVENEHWDLCDECYKELKKILKVKI